MAKNRFPGRGATLSIDVTGDESSYNALLLCRNIKPPAAGKAWIEMMGMEDTAPKGTPGIQEASEFSWEMLFDADDSQDTSVKTAFDNETLCNFKVEVSDGTDTMTISWDGYITGWDPQGFGGNDPVLVSVTGQRVGATTESVATSS